ncbi:MAG: YraN family protein [Planctomycetota bacterium]
MPGTRRPVSRVGRRGERIATRYLKRRGFRVMGRNVDLGVGEADLVCVSPDRDALVVVEVKTRTGSDGDRRPESQVGRAKQRKLRQIAQVVRKVVKGKAAKLPVRIDVVAVELRPWPRRSVVRHHKRAVSFR